VFRGRAAPPVPQVRLLGCRPESHLLTALDAVGQPTQAAPRRRRICADVYLVAADGSVGRVIGAVVSGTVEASEPSRLGAGLIDVTVDSDPREPLPTGVLGILQHWYAGRPAREEPVGRQRPGAAPPLGRSGARPPVHHAGPAGRHHL